uniref:Mediator of RNA polymerase II transcription subunit 14 n=2 Tax=Kalmanozyma brasiliensis (strain GHG001) TaxID=1365824 RepID=V5EV45_KALBG
MIVDTKGKQKQIDLIEQIPLAQLEQELPLEEADLVSLAALVERLANYGYESLQNLAETLPSLPSSSKRAKIFNTALDVRKQFIKLLVLSRWSKDVADLQKSRNIIALLSEQQWQHEDVFAGLTDIRKILPNARMRNADLPTAIDVLQTGTYRRLPTSIKDMAVAPKPFTDDQALTIVSRLEDALRTRMACRELVPAPLSNYSIRDGKVHFRVQGLFEAQLTASSGGQDTEVDAHIQSGLSTADTLATSPDDDRWWLLDLSFDVTPTGSGAESSNRVYPRKPKKAYRERLRLWGDQELAPRSQSEDADDAKSTTGTVEGATTVEDSDTKAVSAEETTEAALPTTAEQDDTAAIKVAAERDAPLLRLFAFLQERSLHYQMHILQHQAYELCRLNWGSNLRIETGERPRRLTVHYWTQAQNAADATQKVEGPAVGGSIQITLVDLPDQAGASTTLAALFDHDSDASDPAPDAKSSLATVKRRGLQATWNAHSSILADSEASDLVVSPDSLDIEALLSLVIKRHTLALLRNLQRRILVSDHPVSRLLRPEDCALCVEHAQRKGDEFSTATEASSLSFLQIVLHAKNRQRVARSTSTTAAALPPLRLSVDPVTGRVLLDSEAATGSDSGASQQQAASFTASALATRSTYARLAESSDRINVSIDALFDVLYNLDVFARVEEWERMATYVGLRAVRKLNLRPQDLAKLGATASMPQEAAPQLFIPLRNSFPGYFLALQPSELSGVSIALVYVVQMMDALGAPSLTLQSIEWLDRAKIDAASKAGSEGSDDAFDLGAEVGSKRKAPPVGSQTAEVDASFGKKDLTMEELANVHSYCIALVSYFRVEQQLRMRGIPYLHVGSNTSRSSPPAKRQKRLSPVRSAPQAAEAQDDGLFEEQEGGEAALDSIATDPAEKSTEDGVDGVAALVPSLCLRATDLLGPAKAHLTKPNVSLRVCHWNDSDRSCVQMHIKLRMKSRRFRPLHEIVSSAPTADAHTTSPLTWIDFDNETSLLTLSTRDLDNCIPIFYAQWERVMRMVQLTREVLNASRAWQLRAVREGRSCKKPDELVELQRFEFDTLVASYGTIDRYGEERKLVVRVRWQDAKVEMQPFTNIPVTQIGGYTLEFGSMAKSDGLTEEAFDDAHAAANPHNVMAFELRRTVNVSARSAAISAPTYPNAERLVWKGFFKLLQETLPLVREIAPFASASLSDPTVPEVEIKSATWVRLRFADRYAVDVQLATRARLVVSDASRALFRSEMATTEAKEEEGLFGGSDLLNDLIAGKIPTAAEKSTVTVTPVESTALQFQPIPNMDLLMQRVATALQTGDAAKGKAGMRGVWDLRRALLVSLTPAEAGGSGTVLRRLIPMLVEAVVAEIGR